MDNRAEVPERDKANEAEVPAGSVPRPLRNDAEPALGGDPLELADDWIPAPLPVSPYERHISPLLCCPTLSRVKGCRRTQETSGRMRLATELANDAVNSLHWLAGHKDSSLTKSILPSGAILVTRVFDIIRQCTSEDRCVALSAAFGMSDCSVSSSPGNLASHKKTAVSPRREYMIALTSSTWCCRQVDGVWRRNNSE